MRQKPPEKYSEKAASSLKMNSERPFDTMINVALLSDDAGHGEKNAKTRAK